MTFAILLAAGSSTRFGSAKVFAKVGGIPVWRKSAEAFFSHPSVDGVVLVGTQDVLEAARDCGLAWQSLVPGGSSRQESALNGLRSLPESASVVLVHDAARPWVSGDLITRVIEGVQRSGAAFPALSVTDTIKRLSSGSVETLDRASLVSVQTPQGATRELFLAAHAAFVGEATDDMALLEAMGVFPEPVPGDPANIKITHPGDEKKGVMEFRTGIGYDIHRFSEDPDRPMWLGGVEFESRPGLEGHSDADALIHAVVDAILGAAALGDIGQLFPNTDMSWKNARSAIFLEEAARRVQAEGWTIVHVDCSLAAERPKVMKRAVEIREALSAPLGISVDQVSVKATTNEGLGAIGRGEGIAAVAVATLRRG